MLEEWIKHLMQSMGLSQEQAMKLAPVMVMAKREHPQLDVAALGQDPAVRDTILPTAHALGMPYATGGAPMLKSVANAQGMANYDDPGPYKSGGIEIDPKAFSMADTTQPSTSILELLGKLAPYDTPISPAYTKPPEKKDAHGFTIDPNFTNGQPLNQYDGERMHLDPRWLVSHEAGHGISNQADLMRQIPENNAHYAAPGFRGEDQMKQPMEEPADAFAAAIEWLRATGHGVSRGDLSQLKKYDQEIPGTVTVVHRIMATHTPFDNHPLKHATSWMGGGDLFLRYLKGEIGSDVPRQ